MRTSLRRTSTPASVAASATSMIPTEPEESAFTARPAGDDEVEGGEVGAPPLGADDLIRRLALEIGPALLESRDVALRGGQRLALGNQVVPGVAGLHVHAVTEPPEARDPLQQDYLHSPLPCRASSPGCRFTPRPAAAGPFVPTMTTGPLRRPSPLIESGVRVGFPARQREPAEKWENPL